MRRPLLSARRLGVRYLTRRAMALRELDLFVSHQANRRIITAAAERLGLPDSKVIINLEMYGNTTAGTPDNHRTIIRVNQHIFSRPYLATKLVALDAAAATVRSCS